jgi:exopolysaccharide biosynthesis polyprenyl glycosylphosphotransferase
MRGEQPMHDSAISGGPPTDHAASTATPLASQQRHQGRDDPDAAGGDLHAVAQRVEPTPTGWSRTPIAMQVVGVTLDALALAAAALLVGFTPLAASLAGTLGGMILAPTGLHPSRLKLDLTDDIAGVFGRVCVAVFVALLAWSTAPSAALLSPAVVLAFLLTMLGRGLLYSSVKAARRRGWMADDVLIVGGGQVGLAIARVLGDQPVHGLRPIAFVDGFVDDSSLPVLGSVTELPEVITRTGARHVVIAFGTTREEDMVSVLRACHRLPVEVYTVPRFFELGSGLHSWTADDLFGYPIRRISSGISRRWRQRSKRAFDIVLSSVLLVVSLPLILACAAAVRLSSPGPAIFRQTRIGEGGGPFELLKFRTMKTNTDSDHTWSVEGDHRVTAIGRFLRPTHLDELPQLWNVLRGDMSIVGPRPERPVFVDRFAAEIRCYGDRHRMPAGLTGWAQVNGLWGDTSIEDRARLDNDYIERWTMWTDIRILWRTVPTLMGRR